MWLSSRKCVLCEEGLESRLGGRSMEIGCGITVPVQGGLCSVLEKHLDQLPAPRSAGKQQRSAHFFFHVEVGMLQNQHTRDVEYAPSNPREKILIEG